MKHTKQINSPVYIGDFSYELGENESSIDNLSETKDTILDLKKAGFERYRYTNHSVLDIVSKSIDKFFFNSKILPSEIDAVIFSVGSFGVTSHVDHSFLSDFLLKHNLKNAYPLMSSLSFCGNFIPALKKGFNYIKSGDFENILVLVSEVIPKDISRVAPPSIAIGSDAASCCLLSKHPFSNYEINSISQSVNVNSGLLDPCQDFLKYVSAVGDGIKKSVTNTLSKKEKDYNISKVFTNNYSKNICKSYSTLLGLPENKVYLDNISRFGHAGATDICINFCDYLESNKSLEDTFLLLSSGPFMWGSALINSLSR